MTRPENPALSTAAVLREALRSNPGHFGTLNSARYSVLHSIAEQCPETAAFITTGASYTLAELLDRLEAIENGTNSSWLGCPSEDAAAR